MNALNQEQVLGLVRHALTIVGAVLVASNSLTDATWTVITGSALAIASTIWSLYVKTDSQLIETGKQKVANLRVKG